MFLILFFNRMIAALYHLKTKQAERDGKTSVPALNQLCGELTLRTGTGQF